MDQRDQGTFRERIARNRRNSLLLIAAFLAFVAIFGYIIGFAWLGDPTRALFGLALAGLLLASCEHLYGAGDVKVSDAGRGIGSEGAT